MPTTRINVHLFMQCIYFTVMYATQEMQTVLREPLCIRISGGKLDFPRHASFAAIKIVTWWEADFVTAFKRASGLSSTENETASNGVIKRIQPSDFILLVVDTAEQLLGTSHIYEGKNGFICVQNTAQRKYKK